jgi:hypothetical protein
LEASLNHFKELVNLTKDSYLYANSMQTKQRKIPVGGNDGKNKTWVELLPIYQKEYDNFKKNIDLLKSPQAAAKKADRVQLTDAVKLFPNTYSVSAGSVVFEDTTTTIKNVAKELEGLHGLKLSRITQTAKGTDYTIESPKPVKILVGYFVSKDKKYLQEPQLETDASANDYGQADVKIANAVQIDGMPPVNVHTFSFKPGKNTLTLPKGICLILGVVDEKAVVPVYDAGLSNEGNIKDLRWLFN